MNPYLDLLRFVRTHGVLKPTRCVLKSTGEHVDAISVFAPPPFRWDLADGFPLVTTKRVSFDAIAHELLWFLSGSTNVADLQKHGVHIWDEWADESTGELGPIYGHQWRQWGRPDFDEGVDQVRSLVWKIRSAAETPGADCGRRLVLTAWNVTDIPDMALPPCHLLSIFNVTNGRLSCKTTMRSVDCFLGLPFNIASYALLTSMLAQVASLRPGLLTLDFADAHIYANHLDQVDEQLAREPLPPPTLRLDPSIDDIDGFRREHMEVIDYQHYPTLRGEVAV